MNPNSHTEAFKPLPETHAFLLNGKTWEGRHRRSKIVVQVMPSTTQGYWHIRKTDLTSSSVSDTKKPVAASALLSFIEDDGVDLRDIDWRGSPVWRTVHATAHFKDKRSFVYFLRAGEFVKIGHAIDPRKRAAGMQTGCPYELELAAVIPGGLKEERELQARFHALRARRGGEWFKLEGELRAYVEALA